VVQGSILRVLPIVMYMYGALAEGTNRTLVYSGSAMCAHVSIASCVLVCTGLALRAAN
jgi:hypothetical protein